MAFVWLQDWVSLTRLSVRTRSPSASWPGPAAVSGTRRMAMVYASVIASPLVQAAAGRDYRRDSSHGLSRSPGAVGPIPTEEECERMRSKGMTKVLTALVAALALMAITASVAAAEESQPYFRNVTVKGEKFSGKIGIRTIHLEDNPKGLFECGGGTITGEIDGPKTGSHGAKEVAGVIISGLSCEGLNSFCKTNREHGTIETKPMKGRLAYISKTTHVVGLLLEAEAEPIAKCLAPPQEFTMAGSFIGKIGPVESQTKSFTLTYEQNFGLQIPQHFEGEELIHNLEALEKEGKRSKFALSGILGLTTTNPIELVA